MGFKIEYRRFLARLESQDGQELTLGLATVEKERHSIKLESEFIPLYPLGTALVLFRLDEEGQAIHRFDGKVFTAHEKGLRLTSVSDTVLPGAENFYNGDWDMDIEVKFCQPPPHLPNKRSPSTESMLTMPATLLSLTPKNISFRLEIKPSDEEEDEVPKKTRHTRPAKKEKHEPSMQDFAVEPGARFRVDLPEEFPVTKFEAQVVTFLPFGGNPLYECTMEYETPEDERMMTLFLQILAPKRAKVFHDEDDSSERFVEVPPRPVDVENAFEGEKIISEILDGTIEIDYIPKDEPDSASNDILPVEVVAVTEHPPVRTSSRYPIHQPDTPEETPTPAYDIHNLPDLKPVTQWVETQNSRPDSIAISENSHDKKNTEKQKKKKKKKKKSKEKLAVDNDPKIKIDKIKIEWKEI